MDPIIERKKEEQREKIDVLNEKRSKLKKEFAESIDKFEEQEELIRYVDYVKRHQDKLRRQKEIDEREENYKK